MITLSILTKEGGKFEKVRVGRGIRFRTWKKLRERGQKGQKSKGGRSKKSLGLKVVKLQIYRSYQNEDLIIHFQLNIKKLILIKIDKKFKEGEIVNKQTLFERRLIESPKKPVKILARGNLTKSLIFEGIDKFSKKALEIIKSSNSTIKE
jgi:Ribosomal protein L15